MRGAVIRRLLRTVGLVARTAFRSRAHGGELRPGRPRPGERMVILSPGRRIDDPDEAEALGLGADARRMLTDIHFYALVAAESKRTIICEPHMADAIQAAIDGRDAGHLYTVRPSLACPERKLIVLDEQAMEASFQQAAQQGLRRPYR